MSNSRLPLGEVITNDKPAQLPARGPLFGQHVRLERLEERHFSDLWESIGSHPDIWYFWPAGPYETATEFNNSMKDFFQASEDLGIWVISLLSGPSKGKALGLGFSLSEDRSTNRVAELGAFFGPQLQGTRAGTEVIYILANMMFDANHRRLQWKTNALNVPSRKAAERYGMVYEGTFRQHQINKGRNRDSAWYSIIDTEWPICKKAFEMWLKDENFDEQQQQRRRLEEIRENLKASELEGSG